MSCARYQQATLVQNRGAGSTTGTAVGRVKGLSSLLHIHIQVVYLPNAGSPRPSSFAGNTFDLIGWARTNDGTVQLDDLPINNDGSGDQQAPGGWEGSTALDEISVALAYTGLVGTVGRWLLVVKLEPAIPLADDLFARLAEGVAVSVDSEQVVA